MKKLLEKYKLKINKFGFTINEFKIIAFLVLFFLLGEIIQHISKPEKPNLKRYNYKKVDSLFKINNITKSNLFEKKVDNKDKLSNLSKDKIFKNGNWESVLLKNPVNINSSGKKDLVLLPGIGSKTADKILAYREKHGPFKRKEDLMKIKGIGKKKFEKIKKYIKIK